MVIKTREKLIEVARQLFIHKGVAKTTMNDIAHASDKGRRTIYTYFRNKKEIYNAVLESESESLVASVRDIATARRPVEERLREFFLFRLEHNNVQASSSLKAWLKFDTRRLERINAMVYDKESVILRELLDEGCRLGAFDPARCALLGEFIDECINRLDTTRGERGDTEHRRNVFESFVDFIISDISTK